MNAKGQAAVTDALFFLMVIISLSIFLFGFSTTYGESVKQQVQDEFNVTFATNALKTILYSSTSRDFDKTIYDPNAEVDYLLALVKEDYADDEKMNDREKVVLSDTIFAVLKPIADSTDYIFTITVPSGSSPKLVYMLVHTTNFKKDGPFLPGRYYRYTVDPANAHADYFCGNDVNYRGNLDIKINQLLVNVGPISESSSPIKLSVFGPDGAPGTVNAQADLIMWDPVWLGSTRDRTSGLLYETDPMDPYNEWGCVSVADVKSGASP